MTSPATWAPVEGGCPCNSIRYRLDQSPLVVHCCHCRSCQKESGSAFKINAMVETKFIVLLSAASPEIVPTPSDSGEGQQIHRCPTCKHAIWSNYGHSGDIIRFVKAGTLDEPARVPPDVHIYVRSKLPWIKLDDGTPCFEEFYDRGKVWPKSSLERMQELKKSLSG